MSIEELIKKECPEGVEYTTLGEVVTIARGASPRPIQYFLTDEPDGVHWIKIGDVNPNDKYIVDTAEKITSDGANKSRLLKKGSFILSNSMSFGRPYILKIDGCIHDGWISITEYEESFNIDFLYHLLRCKAVQAYWRMKASSGTVSNLNADIVRATPIPLPPLSVQEKIVEVLDKFTALESELQAELEARKKQYDYYRNELLNFEGKNVEMKTLGDCGEFIRGGGLQKSDFTEEGYPCIHYGQIHTRFNEYTDKTVAFTSNEYAAKLKKAHPGDLLIATTSEDVDACCKAVAWLGDTDVAVSGDMYIYRHNQNPKFMSQLYRTKIFQDFKKTVATGAKVVRVSGENMAKFKFGFPPMEEQLRIVSILDKFEALVNDALPKEIAARHQQYEYYRDKLLSFNSLTVS